MVPIKASLETAFCLRLGCPSETINLKGILLRSNDLKRQPLGVRCRETRLHTPKANRRDKGMNNHPLTGRAAVCFQYPLSWILSLSFLALLVHVRPSLPLILTHSLTLSLSLSLSVCVCVCECVCLHVCVPVSTGVGEYWYFTTGNTLDWVSTNNMIRTQSLCQVSTLDVVHVPLSCGQIKSTFELRYVYIAGSIATCRAYECVFYTSTHSTYMYYVSMSPHIYTFTSERERERERE